MKFSILSIVFLYGASATPSEEGASIRGGRHATERSCEPCSYEVCSSDLNACPETNPFLCLDGKAVGGCTAIADIWLNPEDCNACCDLSSCDAPRAPTCEPCSHEVCSSELNACPTTDPYLCLDGKAVGGCTAIADIWLNSEDCNACCDLSSCDPPPRAPTCEPCSQEVCASDLNVCPETNPFLCLDGKAVGGCTANADIWLNREDCNACCDLSHCDADPKYDEPVCKFYAHFTEKFDTDKLVESNYLPFADISVWEGNLLCKGKDNGGCELKPEYRALSGYNEPDYAIGKAYGRCITLGHDLSVLCTDHFFFDDESKSTLEIQGVTFDTTDHQETSVLGGTGCFKNAQGTVTIAIVKDHEGIPLYANFDIKHVTVPDDIVEYH